MPADKKQPRGRRPYIIDLTETIPDFLAYVPSPLWLPADEYDTRAIRVIVEEL